MIQSFLQTCTKQKKTISKSTLIAVSVILAFSSAICQNQTFSSLKDTYQAMDDIYGGKKLIRSRLVSDKPVYKPGEVVQIALLQVNSTSKVANFTTDDINEDPVLEIVDSQNQILTTLTSRTRDYSKVQDNTVHRFSFKIQNTLPGGSYLIRSQGSLNPDSIPFIVLNFKNRAFGVVGDWNTDIVSPGQLIKGKLTINPLTADPSSFTDIKLNYQFIDQEGNILDSNLVSLTQLEQVLVSYLVPLTGVTGGVVFSVTVTAVDYTTVYQRSFSLLNYDEVVVKVNPASGLVVQGLKNKFFFKAFDTYQEENGFAFKNAEIVLEDNSTQTVLLSGVNSDENGQGNFEIDVPTKSAGRIFIRLTPASGKSVTFDFINFEFEFGFSQILAKVSDLVYGAEDKITVNLLSNGFNGKANIVIQDKTVVLEERLVDFANVASVKTPISETFDINAFNINNGGVVTVQVYIKDTVNHQISEDQNPFPIDPMPFPIPEPVPFPVDFQNLELPVEAVQVIEGQDQVKIAEPMQAAPQPRRLQEVVNKIAVPMIDMIQPIDNQEPVIEKREFIPPISIPEPKAGLKFDGKAVQEVNIFIKPKNIVGVNLSSIKSSYQAGNTISIDLQLDTSCKDCLKNFSGDKVRGILKVIDAAAFLELEKSRENPSLNTQVFLKGEIFTQSKKLRNSYKFVDYLFDSSTRGNNQLEAESKALLTNLLGSQSERHFLYDPSKIYEMLNSYFSSYNDPLIDFKLNLKPYQFQRRFFFDFMVRRGGPVPVMAMAEMMADAAVPNAGEAVDYQAQTTTVAVPQDESNDISNFELEKPTEDSIFFDDIKFDENGKASVNITLPDRATNYVLDLSVFNQKGVYGHASRTFSSKKRINVAIDSPLYIYDKENLLIPAIIENNDSKSVTLRVVTSGVNRLVVIRPGRTLSQIVTLNKNNVPCEFILEENGIEVFRTVIAPRILRPGILRMTGKSGMVSINSNSSSSLDFAETFPSTLIRGGNSLKVCYQNNLVSLIMDLLKNFNVVPSGCFEQASMTTFPIIVAIKILQLLPQTKTVLELLKELIDKLRRGRDLLLSYECPSGGFEWFGKDPGHPTLTAYGLWQFKLINNLNISSVTVSQDIINRTISFLDKNRDNSCGFVLTAPGYDELGRPEKATSDIYIKYAFNLNIPAIMEQDKNCVKQLYQDFKDGKVKIGSYKLALIGSFFFESGDLSLAREIADLLVTFQDPSTGKIINGETSITLSTGTCLDVETTGLTMNLLLKVDSTKYIDAINKALKFLLANLRGAQFCSTQGTIMSLLAIAEYINVNPVGSGANLVFDVLINNNKQGEIKIANTDSFSGACLDLNKQLLATEAPGLSLQVVVKPSPASLSDSKSTFLFQTSLTYYSLLPTSATGSPLRLTVSPISSGLTLTFRVNISNLEKKEQGMVLYELLKPSCYDFNVNDLELLRDSGKISFYEIRNFNSKIVFYWRGMKPSSSISFNLSLYKRFSNTSCSAQPHQAYLYYDQSGSVRYAMPAIA